MSGERHRRVLKPSRSIAHKAPPGTANSPAAVVIRRVSFAWDTVSANEMCTLAELAFTCSKKASSRENRTSTKGRSGGRKSLDLNQPEFQPIPPGASISTMVPSMPTVEDCASGNQQRYLENHFVLLRPSIFSSLRFGRIERELHQRLLSGWSLRIFTLRERVRWRRNNQHRSCGSDQQEARLLSPAACILLYQNEHDDRIGADFNCGREPHRNPTGVG